MRFWKDHSGMEMLEAAITTPIAILVMLAMLMAFAFYNDINRLVSG